MDKPLYAVFRRLLLLLVLACVRQTAMATNYAGADLYVDFIGEDSTDLRYRIHLVIYKVCEPATTGMAPAETVQVSSAGAGFSFMRSLAPLAGTQPDTLGPRCLSSCYQPGASRPGMTRREYTDTVSVPARSADLRFYWNNGTRSSGIVNLAQSGQQAISIECIINNLLPGHWYTSSPRYNADPVPYVCLNQPGFYITGPVSPAGDSLVTANESPRGNGILLPFSSPFNLTDPIASSTGYVLNSITGTAQFTPSVAGKFTMAFKTTAYDRQTGAFLSSIVRDVQVIVLACSSPAPTVRIDFGGMIGGVLEPDGSISVPPGTTLHLDVTGLSGEPGGTMLLIADNVAAAPGSQLTVSYPAADTARGQLSWTPAAADSGAHQVVFTVRDTLCSGPQSPVAVNAEMLTIRVGQPTGIPAAGKKEAFIVFPSPARDRLYLRGTGIVKAVVYALTGQEVAVFNHPAGSLDIRPLPAGTYHVRIVTADGTGTARFVKE